MKRNLLILITCTFSLVPAFAPADVPERTSTLADQQAVNVTIYNNDTALVHDRRRVALSAGINHIAWRDVSASMDATSAILDADGSSRVSVLEQNFDYDVLGQDALLRKYVGYNVIVVHPARFAGERDRRERAKILSYDNGDIVLQYADRVETRIDGYIVFPRIPQSLRDRPTLTLDLQSARVGPQQLDLRYLTSGLSWNVAYVGTLSADQSQMSLVGLVTLNNTSGTSYHNARLQLVAGSLNLPATPGPLRTIARVTSNAGSDIYNVNAAQESIFAYHLYTIGHPTTILDKQTKQLALISANDIPVTTTLELHGSTYYFQNANVQQIGERLPVSVIVTFENKGGDLGIPLPAGQMRIYQDDSHGLAQFVGADNIPHTPKNDTVRLHLGDSFDVVAHRRQTDFHLLSNCNSRSAYEIDLTNGKDIAQDVTVFEPMPGLDWKITAESQPHDKPTSTLARWLVRVPADGGASLTYTAEVRWCR
ncbi:MAG TPA: DUF4139 domain-containing protein [Candidatus Aquilonibacter sp.]